jgi:hypothetical protein
MREPGLLHAVVDALPDAALDEVSRYLAAHRDDPVLRSLLRAPPEDEAPSPTEEARLAKAWADNQRDNVRRVPGGGNRWRRRVGDSG